MPTIINLRGNVTLSIDGTFNIQEPATGEEPPPPPVDNPVTADDVSGFQVYNSEVLNGNVLANTLTPDGLGAVTVSVNPTQGTVTMNANGDFTYTPNGTFVGNDSFTFRVTDTDGDFDTGIATIQVIAAPDDQMLKGYTFLSDVLETGVTFARDNLASHRDSNGFLVTVGDSVPRNDWRIGLDRAGLMIEPAADSLSIHSNDFSSTGQWQSSLASISSQQGTSPEGTNNAWKMTCTGSSFSNMYRQIFGSAGQKRTISIFVKKAAAPQDTPWFWFGPKDHSSARQLGFHYNMDTHTFNDSHLTTGGDLLQYDDHGVEEWGNGWYRAWFTFTMLLAAPSTLMAHFRPTNGVDQNVNPNGDGFLIYGYNRTMGDLTSYIPTAGVTITRGAETVSLDMPDGTYDIMVKNKTIGEWRNAVVVSGTEYNLTAMNGSPHVSRVEFYTAGALTQLEKDNKLADVLPPDDGPAEPPPPIPGYDLPVAGYTLTKDYDFGVNITDLTQMRNEFYTRYAYSGGTLDFLNDEWQRYRDNDNHRINNTNGTLELIARLPAGTTGFNTSNQTCSPSGQRIQSGMVRSKYSQRYGFWDIRAKVPPGRGMWPALWMLADLRASGGDWPPEIDIMEIVNNGRDTTRNTFHNVHRSNCDAGSTTFTLLDQWGSYRPAWDFKDDYHRFGMEWTPTYVAHYVDNVMVVKRNYGWKYDDCVLSNPAHTLMNLAVGGSWPSAPQSVADFPATFHIDYCRIYTKTA